MSRFQVLPRLAVLLILSAGSVYSQTTFASITGTVRDSGGAVVPNAAVTATNLATNIKSTARSNESGTYTIPQLLEGSYTLRAEAPGFKSFVVDNVVLAARH